MVVLAGEEIALIGIFECLSRMPVPKVMGKSGPNCGSNSEFTTGAGLPNTQDQALLVGLVSEERSLVR